jgi:hypothetical protein
MWSRMRTVCPRSQSRCIRLPTATTRHRRIPGTVSDAVSWRRSHPYSARRRPAPLSRPCVALLVIVILVFRGPKMGWLERHAARALRSDLRHRTAVVLLLEIPGLSSGERNAAEVKGTRAGVRKRRPLRRAAVSPAWLPNAGLVPESATGGTRTLLHLAPWYRPRHNTLP